jgi:hypothetical protein
MYEGPLAGNSYGVVIRPEGVSQWRRPASKKEVKELLLKDPDRVIFESTSLHHPNHTLRGSDLLLRLQDGTARELTFVGPNPETDRRFFGSVKLRVKTNQLRVT